MKIIVVAITFLLCLIGIAVGNNPSAEQRLISLDANSSSGSLTGDDFVILLINAVIEDYRSGSYTGITPGPNYDSVYKTAMSQFPEYHRVYAFDSGVGAPTADYEIGKINLASYGDKETLKYLETHKNDLIDYIFDSESSLLKEARADVQKRLDAESSQRTADAHRKDLQQEAEKERELEKQAEAANQLALDAHYKNISENYTSNLTVLLNQSKFADALNLSEEAIKHLVSPYSNMMMISKGDVFTSMGRYEDAIESYQTSQKVFVYDNDSIDYQNKVLQDFNSDRWNVIAEYKANVARQKLSDQIDAKKHDLRDAPNVMQLLRGHDSSRKYSVNIEKDTFLGACYVVSINLSAINKPIDPTDKTDANSKVIDDVKVFVPVCVDMFGCLFADKRITYVCIQNNQTYLDRFGHKNEVAVWRACMDNNTATQVGNWNDLKQYVGTDLDKLASVASFQEAPSG